MHGRVYPRPLRARVARLRASWRRLQRVTRGLQMKPCGSLGVLGTNRHQENSRPLLRRPRDAGAPYGPPADHAGGRALPWAARRMGSGRVRRLGPEELLGLNGNLRGLTSKGATICERIRTDHSQPVFAGPRTY